MLSVLQSFKRYFYNLSVFLINVSYIPGFGIIIYIYYINHYFFCIFMVKLRFIDFTNDVPSDSIYFFFFLHSPNGCVGFDSKCVMPELYESNWCVIDDTLDSSHKTA